MFNKYADPREGPQVCVAGRQSPRAMLAATRNQCFHVKVYNSRLYFRYLWIIFTKINNKTVYSKNTFVCYLWRNRLTISPFILLVDTYYTTRVESKQPVHRLFTTTYLQTEASWRLHPACVYQARGCSRRRQTLHEWELRWWNFHWSVHTTFFILSSLLHLQSFPMVCWVTLPAPVTNEYHIFVRFYKGTTNESHEAVSKVPGMKSTKHHEWNHICNVHK